MECPHCKNKSFYLNGTDKKTGRQRYQCKNCKKEYPAPKVTYTKTEKRLLSFLVNFLETDLGELNLKELLEKSKDYRPGISNIKIESCKEVEPYSRIEYQVKCKKPRLLICEDKNGIKIVKIPSKVASKCKNSFYFVVD